MQLKRVAVHSLFGRFDHDIPLNLGEKITIITAPNGYGKTVLLNLITHFLTKQFNRMKRYSFETIEFTFSNNRRVVVRWMDQEDLFDEENKSRSGDLLIEPVGFPDDPESWHPEIEPDRMTARSFREYERYLPFLDRIGPEEWLDERTGETYSTTGIIERFSNKLPRALTKSLKVPDWLEETIETTECHLIETQRLLRIQPGSDFSRRRSHRETQSAVAKNAEDLSEHIASALRNYANASQKLDQSFPKRVLQKLTEAAPSASSIRDRLKSLEERRTELVNTGLLDQSNSQQISAADLIPDKNIRNVLDVYVSDTEEKLDVFDDMYERIKLFRDIMTEHFRFKKLVIDPANGMFIEDQDSSIIPLEELSSGEQHELVLIYDLLFKVSSDALILIDEPELSLHVGWQKRFIEDIEKIQKLRPLNVIIATHSPQIISDRWDLTVDLAVN